MSALKPMTLLERTSLIVRDRAARLGCAIGPCCLKPFATRAPNARFVGLGLKTISAALLPPPRCFSLGDNG